MADPSRKRKCLPDHALHAHQNADDAFGKIDRLAEMARSKLRDGNNRRVDEALQDIQIEALRAREKLREVRLAQPEREANDNGNGILIVKRKQTLT
jgi:hypothetical protein